MQIEDLQLQRLRLNSKTKMHQNHTLNLKPETPKPLGPKFRAFLEPVVRTASLLC